MKSVWFLDELNKALMCADVKIQHNGSIIMSQCDGTKQNCQMDMQLCKRISVASHAHACMDLQSRPV
jgi:hypothetical protein